MHMWTAKEDALIFTIKRYKSEARRKTALPKEKILDETLVCHVQTNESCYPRVPPQYS